MMVCSSNERGGGSICVGRVGCFQCELLIVCF